MSVRLENRTLVIRGPAGEFFPTSEEVYAVVYEGKTSVRSVALIPDDLHALGLRFSANPATPVIVLSASATSIGDPTIACRLAGRVGKATGIASVDYVIIDDVWYPLPQHTVAEFEAVLKDSGISDSAALTLGNYLEIQKHAKNFIVEDLASAHLVAGALSTKIPPQAIVGLEAVPYPYQTIGLQWLRFMARQGVGCILADEMGLGKTLQVIAVFLAEVRAHRRPNLVICPATLMENWRRELARFAPSLSILIHAGAQRTGSATGLTAADVTVVSYETMATDISLFRAVSWNVVALDEAQNIKNPHARRTQRAKQLSRRMAIAITGTPVENRLKDLWSLCDFVLPGHLGAESEFDQRFTDTEDGAKEVEPLVSAIMLRRRIRDVAADLPARIDIPVPLVMDSSSCQAYEQIREEAVRNAPAAPSLAALIFLRMFCSHPWAVDKLREAPSALSCSPKMQRCFEILEEIFGGGSKVIVFTSFNKVADLLASEIEHVFHVPTWKINGSIGVPARQEIVDRFSTVNGPAALVLNPRAAGVGLNITAANHVIHYNLEWNPAVEDQASARSHRRGQMRPVTVHRLFYVDTVEEVINERMSRKRALSESAVVGTRGDADDIADILIALKRTPLVP